MKKTLLLGVLLGISAAIALAGWYPVVDPVRFPSEAGVAKNGGRTENFRVYLPEDRLAVTGSTMPAGESLPADLRFPPGPELAGLSAEFFKLRNDSGTVIGVAGRVNARSPDGRGYTDWTLFLPARGSLFLTAEVSPGWPYGIIRGAQPVGDPAAALGDIVGGAGEFTDLVGSFREEWIVTGRDEDGRLRGEIGIATLTLRADQ